MAVMDDDAAGSKNLESAISGDASLSARREQIEALGGELDDDLDLFKPTPESRGDFVADDDDSEPPARSEAEPDGEDTESDEESSTEEPEEEGGDADEADSADADDSESSQSDSDDDDDSGDEDTDPRRTDLPRIPKARFDEVNARRKAAEDRVKELEAQLAAKEQASKQAYDFDAAEQEYGELLLDGKFKEAAAKRREINAALEAEWEAKQAAKTEMTVAQRELKKDLNAISRRLESEYAEFDPESELYSEDLTAEVLSMFEGYLSTRMDLTPQEALQLAGDNVVRLYGLKKVGTSEEPPSASKDKPNVRKVAKKDTKKKIELAKKAPKDIGAAGKSGTDHGEKPLDINSLSDDELMALPESTLKRLRGDFV